jgi:trimeric autotransporter adhesin
VSDVWEKYPAALVRDGRGRVCAVRGVGGASYALTLPRDSVGPRQLRARAVTSTKLGSGAVTARALRDGAVSGRKIASGSVRASDLGGGSVRTAALANGAVTAAKLAPDSVTAAQLSLPVVSVQAFSPAARQRARVRLIAATCAPGQRVVGGGGGWVSGSTVDAVGFGVVAGSRPTPPTAGTDSQNGWEVYGTDAPHPMDRRLMVTAICIAT